MLIARTEGMLTLNSIAAWLLGPTLIDHLDDLARSVVLHLLISAILLTLIGVQIGLGHLACGVSYCRK